MLKSREPENETTRSNKNLNPHVWHAVRIVSFTISFVASTNYILEPKKQVDIKFPNFFLINAGLNYIIEYRSKDNFPFLYECQLCHCKTGLSNMFMHVCGSKHRLAYLVSFYSKGVCFVLFFNYCWYNGLSREFASQILIKDLVFLSCYIRFCENMCICTTVIHVDGLINAFKIHLIENVCAGVLLTLSCQCILFWLSNNAKKELHSCNWLVGF